MILVSELAELVSGDVGSGLLRLFRWQRKHHDCDNEARSIVRPAQVASEWRPFYLVDLFRPSIRGKPSCVEKYLRVQVVNCSPIDLPYLGIMHPNAGLLQDNLHHLKRQKL